MNFKIIAAIVGIIASMTFSVSCQEEDGVICEQMIVCDQYGRQYPTPCDFFDAEDLDDTLEIEDCPVEDSWNVAAPAAVSNEVDSYADWSPVDPVDNWDDDNTWATWA